MNKKLFVIVILLFLILFKSFAGRVFYVSSSYTGATSNGSLSTPWKSLANVQSSMSTFVAGDSILFKRGDKFSGTLLISKSGTATNKIVFAAYGVGNDPMFWGTGSVISNLFNVGNQSHIVFYGLKISDTTISATDRTIVSKIQTAFGFDVNSTYNIIRKCKLDRVGVGAYFQTTSSYNTIDSCDIGNMRMVVNDNTKAYNDYGANPTVISGSYNTITHNFFHDCWANSYDFGYDGGAVEFYGNGANNNFIAYNTFYDCNGVVENGSGNGGTISNNTFAYNKFINNGSVFYINNNGTYAVTVSNLAFYNNVIVQTVPSRVGTTSLGGMSVNTSNQNIAIFKNNIFFVNTGADIMRYGQWTTGQLVHQSNIYNLSNGSVANFSLTANETQTSANVWTNTTNTNPLYWDYSPIANSNIIDFGQSLGYTRDFAGNALNGLPEAGILEKTIAYASTPLTIAVNAGSILCNGSTTVVNVTASGGVTPYTGTGSFTKAAGTYTYTVTDATGTSKSSTITISQPIAINITLAAAAITLAGGTTSIDVTVSGGSGTGYTYKLNNGSYQTSSQFKRISAGTYTVTVKDSRGCTKSKTIVITQPSIREASGKSTNGSTSVSGNLSSDLLKSTATTSNQDELLISAFPNPTPTGFNLTLNGTDNHLPLSVFVLNSSGQKVFVKTTTDSFLSFGHEFQPGLYYISISQNGKVLKTLKVAKI